MGARDKFKVLRNLSHDSEDVRLLRLLGQLMSKGSYRDIDTAIKRLYLINGNYRCHTKNPRIVIDHNACERLRELTRSIDQENPPYRTKIRLQEIDKIINRLNNRTYGNI